MVTIRSHSLIILIVFLFEWTCSRDLLTDSQNVTGHRSKRYLSYRSRLRQIYSLCNYPDLKCSPFDRYRSPDGICNNPSAPYWGATDTSLRRIVRNYYDDGISEPRSKGIDNNELPNVRYISNTISVDFTGDVKNPFTNLHQTFGQFLDHDIGHTPNILDKDKKKIKCCTPELTKNGGQHSDIKTGGPCFPIEIPTKDPFFQPRRCMNFVRSIEVTDKQKKCRSAAREQMNKLTSFIDASNIYGLTVDDGKKLRTFKGGLMKVSAYDLLPENINGECEKRNSSDYCFLAGDMRVNEHPGLSAFHAIFVRYHNKIAANLKQLNGRNRLWDDERIYQETKKIVNGVLQNIVYNEYLPKLVGDVATIKYKLKSSLTGQHRFLSSIDPRIMNAFSTAAFRYGHSSIPNEWSYGDKKVPLVAMFNSPFFIQDFKGKGLDMIVEGMVKDSSQPADKSFSNGVRNTLFKTFKVPGLDLVALNLQRGRDHGLAPYNIYREYCGLKPIEKFDGSTDQIRTLAQAYKHPNDVDLFIGGMTEPTVHNGKVGPTFACLIASQFHNLKYGDRFWFENVQQASPFLPVNPAAFSIGQIQAIRQVSIARILCDTTDIKYVPRYAFFHPSARLGNRRVSCKDYYSLPGLTITPWRTSLYG
ncbi:hypothetical protein LOTGIDRAFT_163526 [Lottia gigantea]|uniref:Uncharacterized protein n=1 Tax=Lottia gigantea TaxID=225164 RepID=V4A7L3_LOTGI|nr:hypothetical protein LOTGIDRAFT_163526 [Lottia gigantea]ESO91010.1 hypothetical protein LOTGIDRAFT_163526 [Lottia gigantea]